MDINRIKKLDDKFASYFKIYNRWNKLVFSNDLMRNIIEEIDFISKDIKESHPFISSTLSELKHSIFTRNHTLEVISTTRLNDILNILIKEYNNINIWRFIHPRIIYVSKKLYCDGHYSSSALNAVKYPRQSRGLVSVSRSKRLNLGPPKGNLAKLL